LIVRINAYNKERLMYGYATLTVQQRL